MSELISCWLDLAVVDRVTWSSFSFSAIAPSPHPFKKKEKRKFTALQIIHVLYKCTLVYIYIIRMRITNSVGIFCDQLMPFLAHLIYCFSDYMRRICFYLHFEYETQRATCQILFHLILLIPLIYWSNDCCVGTKLGCYCTTLAGTNGSQQQHKKVIEVDFFFKNTSMYKFTYGWHNVTSSKEKYVKTIV